MGGAGGLDHLYELHLNDAAPSYRPGGRRLAWNAWAAILWLQFDFDFVFARATPGNPTREQAHPHSRDSLEEQQLRGTCVEAVSLLCILGGIFRRPASRACLLSCSTGGAYLPDTPSTCRNACQHIL